MSEYRELDAVLAAVPAKYEAVIRALPAERVRPAAEAQWELDSDGVPVCSKCGELALQRAFLKVPHLIQDLRFVRSRYCPNCGADMRAPAE